MNRLTEEMVIANGGWHPAYARVLLVAELDDHAVVIVDGNGDGTELELEHWLSDGSTWHPGSSSGMGALDSARSWSSGWTAGAGYAVGRGEPGTAVQVEWRGEVREAVANHYGLWIALFPDQPPPGEPAGLTSGLFGGPSGDHIVSQADWNQMRGDSPRPIDRP